VLCVYGEFILLCLTDLRYLNRNQNNTPSYKKFINLDERTLCTFILYGNEYFEQQYKYFHFQITQHKKDKKLFMASYLVFAIAHCRQFPKLSICKKVNCEFDLVTF